MATSYPGALDALTNPTASDTLDSVTVPHADQHANANDAIEAIEAELGTDPAGTFSTVVARLNAMRPVSTVVAMTSVHPSKLTATVGAASCTSSTPVMVTWGPVVNTDENDPDFDDVTFSAVPGSGQFTLIATSRTTEPIRGSFRINYLIGV